MLWIWPKVIFVLEGTSPSSWRSNTVRHLVRYMCVCVSVYSVCGDGESFYERAHCPCTVNKLSKLIQSIPQYGAQRLWPSENASFFSLSLSLSIRVSLFSGQMNDLYMSLRLAAFGSNINMINNTTDRVLNNWLERGRVRPIQSVLFLASSRSTNDI